jgi:hypothetical protein
MFRFLWADNTTAGRSPPGFGPGRVGIKQVELMDCKMSELRARALSVGVTHGPADLGRARGRRAFYRPSV